MSCANEIRLNDIGTKFQFTIYECIDGVDTIVDISTADNIEIIFKGPDDIPVTKIGVLTTDGTDGKVHYITITGDIDQLGKWEVQAKVNMTVGTAEFWSSIINFRVVENLKP